MVVGVDVLQRDRGELRGELRGQSDGQRHPSLQLGVSAGAVIVIVIIIASLALQQQSVSQLYYYTRCLGLYVHINIVISHTKYIRYSEV